VLILEREYEVFTQIERLQQKHQMYDEIKYMHISQYNMAFYNDLIDLVGDISFQYYIVDFERRIHEYSYIDAVDLIYQDIQDEILVFFDYFTCHPNFIIEQKIQEKLPFVRFALRQNSR
jgi:hypothetical protein